MGRYLVILMLGATIASAQPSRSPLGINLAGVVDYSTELPFVDVFKASRPWIPQLVSGGPWDTGAQLHINQDGWIASLDSGQAAATLMTREIDGHYPGGMYTCLYDGEGDIQFGMDAQEASRTAGRILLNVTPGGGGIYLKIVATNPSNPIRNIRVIMPGFEDVYQAQPFNPVFLHRLSGFTVLRFMDWGSTNNSPVQNWSDRTTPTYVSQASAKGVALEYMIKLANTLHANPWFCIPHQATNDYVSAFAALVRDSLDPSLKAYIEYSNEVWNGQFDQAAYASAHGLALSLSSDAFEAQLRFYSQRAVEIFGIVSSVFGGTQRLVRVLASQSANPWTGTTVMDWNSASAHADAYAVAPYFGGFLGSSDLQSQVQLMSVDQILDSCSADIQRVMATSQTNKSDASSRGLQLVCYESGQHLVGVNGVENNTTITGLFIAANRHPRMKELYLDYLNRWNVLGGGMMGIFSFVGIPSKWGSWGILEWMDQDSTLAPKYWAVRDYLAGVTSVVLVTLIPETFSLGQNWPNPFNPSTNIGYTIASSKEQVAGSVKQVGMERVRLVVYDLLGREVAVLVDGIQTPGEHRITFDARRLASGMYFYRLSAGGQVAVKRMILVR